MVAAVATGVMSEIHSAAPHNLAGQEGGLESSEGAAAFLEFARAYDTVDRGFVLRAIEIRGGAVISAG